MKIAFLQASLIMGGAERLVQSIITRMDRSKVQPIAVTLYETGMVGDQLRQNGETVFSELACGKWDLGVGKRLSKLFEEQNVEAFYVADSALPLFWAGRLRRKQSKPKLIMGFHSMGKAGDFFQHRIANTSAFPVVDRFIALSETHRDFLCEQFGLSKERFSIIPVGVDTQRFAPAEDKAAAKRKVGLPEEAFVVGIVAALRPEKNHPLFLRMASILHAKYQNAKFIIVGDGSERERLEQEAAGLCLSDTVLFLGARNDTPDLYRAMDVAALCSHPVIETFPQVLVEAQASGTPVVSTDVGSIRDVIAENDTGFLVPTGDVDALSSKIEQLLVHSSLRFVMGQAARERAERLFTIEQMVSAYEQVFLEVVRLGGSSS